MSRAVAICLVLLGITGCFTRFRDPPPPVASPSELRNVQSAEDISTVHDPKLYEEITSRLLQVSNKTHPGTGRQFNTLVLSGGGMYGAYTAGVLVGWTEAGTRPSFDVVTGISTGALAGTMAFLGPTHDKDLKRCYTTVSDDDIYLLKPQALAIFTESLADSTPLQRLIAGVVDLALLKEVAAEYAKGRRLYVGTTHIDSRRLVVWDMGAIASRGDAEALDLFRRILLASASIPGFFPPVPFKVEVNGKSYEELHVDGGVSASMFFRPPHFNKEDADKAGDSPLSGSNLYIIIAGKLYADPALVPLRFSRIATDSISSLIFSQTRGDLYQLYTLALVNGMNFRFTAIPADFSTTGDSTDFNRKEMGKLFEEGRRIAVLGQAWRSTPPGTERDEQVVSRTGTKFMIVSPPKADEVKQAGHVTPASLPPVKPNAQ